MGWWLAACSLAWCQAAGSAPAVGTGADVALPAAAPVAGEVVRTAVAGRGLGAWTAQWWRWAGAQPLAPYLDPDGTWCMSGQEGPVWFLAGTDGSFSPRRECVVPEGKYLLVPVINMIHFARSGADTRCTELQQRAAVNNDRLASAVVLLDGVSLGDMRRHRVRSDGCFRMDEEDSGSRLAAADGYWLMLAPLPRGRHTLVVGANYSAGEQAYGEMNQRFEYVLHVGGRVLLSEAPRGDIRVPPRLD